MTTLFASDLGFIIPRKVEQRAAVRTEQQRSYGAVNSCRIMQDSTHRFSLRAVGTWRLQVKTNADLDQIDEATA